MLKQKTTFSGIQPSGDLHLGQYFGAISQWVGMQKYFNCIFSVVDYHAITVRQEPDKLKNRIINTAKAYLAAGIDPEKSIIFQQSTVPAHTELAWILNCYGARMADLNKMTQFKSKADKNQETVSVGLFDYPVLTAADILLYNTDAVPVGEDQKQHVELAREIAKRFNNKFSPLFKLPEVSIRKDGARIMSLQDPSKKMSKSDNNENNYISLLDDIEVAKKKIIKAVTDSGEEIIFDKENKPAISNLLIMYSLLADKSIKDLERQYDGQGYGVFKKDLAEEVAKFLDNFQKKYNSFSDEDVIQILQAGTKKANEIARETMEKVRKLIGVR